MSRVISAALPLATVVAFATAPSAAAHDSLASSNPAAGQELTKAPENLQLTFTADILKMGTQVAVTSPGGSTPKTLAAATSGKVVTAPFSAAGNGKYTVTWRVTSSDGHPISGEYTFTLKGQSNSTVPSTSAGPSALGNVSGPSSSPSVVKGPTTPTTDEPGDNMPWLVGGVTALALGLIAVGYFVARNRTRVAK